MSQIELFSLRPLLSFESLISNKNKELFNIDSVDDFEILSWTAGGRFDGREFVVIACKSKGRPQPFANVNPDHFPSSNPNPDPSSSFQPRSRLNDSDESQQFLIIRSISSLPQKLRSKYRRRSKREHAKLVNDSNIQHLYGDVYHIAVDDDDDDDDDDGNGNDNNSNSKSIDPHSDHKDDQKEDVHSQSKDSRPSKPRNERNRLNPMNGTNPFSVHSPSPFPAPTDDEDDSESDGIHSVSSVDSEPPDIETFGKHFGPSQTKEGRINYSEYDELPVLRIITWFKTAISCSFDKSIVAMDFNPSGTWLMVTCRDCSIYLLPLRHFLSIPTHQLELSVTTAYELNNHSEDDYFEQQFGFVNQSASALKRGGMIRSQSHSQSQSATAPTNTNMASSNMMKRDSFGGPKGPKSPKSTLRSKRRSAKQRDNINNIGSTSLAHLVLHRGKTNKTKSKKGWTSGWFGSSKRSAFTGGNAPFSVRSMSGGTIRNGSDSAETLEDAVCADGKESFGPQHDLTILSHGICRVADNEELTAIRKKTNKSNKRKKDKKHKLSEFEDEKNKEICALCSVWWTTRARKDFVIFGTNDGRICLVNVRSHNKTWIEIGGESLQIVSLELIIDIKSSSVLIHCSDNLYYILLLERPHRSASSSSLSSGHPLSGTFNGAVSQELLMAGYMMNHPHRQLDASQINEWDTIIDHFHLNAFHPLQLNLGDDDDTTPNTSTLSLRNDRKDDNKHSKSTTPSSLSNEVTVSLSVYHNTGSVIADPHQQTPTPSEKAARMLGIPYPRRRIVANSSPNGGGAGSGGSSRSTMANGADPLRTEHAQSCVHFGVFYHKQSKLALHALDEIYQPPRAGFRIDPSLANIFVDNFIVSLAPNHQLNQISIIAPPLASLMNPAAYDSEEDDDDEEELLSDDEIILSSNSDINGDHIDSHDSNESESDDQRTGDGHGVDELHGEEEEDGLASVHTVKDEDNGSIQRTQDMLSDFEDDDDMNRAMRDKVDHSDLRNLNLKRALLRHRGKRSDPLQRRLSHGGVVQNLLLDPDEKVQAILDRTTSVIMSNPKIYIERLDPLALSQLNRDATDAFDTTITPTMSKSEIPYGATHSVWSSLKSQQMLLLTNKAVYQIEKQFDGFSTVLQSVEKADQFADSRNVVSGLAACCEVNAKSIYEIAADRMLAHHSRIRDAGRSFELYARSSVTVAKLIRQFLRPEWLHDAKHDIIVSRIFGILKRLLTTADIPSRVQFSDIMFNLLLLQYHIHHPFLEEMTSREDTIRLLSHSTQKMIAALPREVLNAEEQVIDEDDADPDAVDGAEEDSNEKKSDSHSASTTTGFVIERVKESEAELRRRKLIHFISLNRECSLKTVIRKLLNMSQQELALHVLQSHDHPKSLGANANLPVGSGPAAQIAQAAALKQAQSGISLNVTGNLTDFFLAMCASLGLDLEAGTASFVIRNYPLLFLERKMSLKCIPAQFWTDLIFQTMDKVVTLCENSSTAQRYYQTQQLFRQKKQQQRFHEAFTKEAESEDAAKNAEKYGEEERQQPHQEVVQKQHRPTPPPSQPPPVPLKPKSFQEETRMRQKQLVQYLAENISILSLAQLVTIHSYLTRLTRGILETLYPSNGGTAEKNGAVSDEFDALSWSTPGWLLLHLKVLLRIRSVNRMENDGWNEFGDDEYGKEFEVYLDRVLSKFTGMLDVTLILDEMLRANDLPMAMLLHEKLSNAHDYVVTYTRFLLQQSRERPHRECLLQRDGEYRQKVLERIMGKVVKLQPTQNAIILGQQGPMAHAQGRCLAKWIGLWMQLGLPLREVEDLCVDKFEAIKYGLTNVLFHHWSRHQKWFTDERVPPFSPRLMLKVTNFALSRSVSQTD